MNFRNLFRSQSSSSPFRYIRNASILFHTNIPTHIRVPNTLIRSHHTPNMCCLVFTTFTHCAHIEDAGFYPCTVSKAKGTEDKKRPCSQWGPNAVVPSGAEYCQACNTKIYAVHMLDRKAERDQQKILSEVRRIVVSHSEMMVLVAPLNTNRQKMSRGRSRMLVYHL